MMSTVVAGRVYNGKVHDWAQNKGKDNEQERSLFRGRLNYRNPENGEYHYIDAVCFKDFGDKGGLVAWLDDHYAAENSESEKGGDAIIVTGYVRPTEKKKTIEIKGKKNGKTITKEIPNVPYDSFEFVILSATFPPTSQGDSHKSNDVETEEDFEDFDDIEVSSGDEEEAEAEEVEDKPKAKKQTTSKTKKEEKAKKTSKPKIEEDDDDFFEEAK
jgi:hypothetical protein